MKKLLLAGLTLTSIVVLSTPLIPHSLSAFSDVSETHPHHDGINYVQSQGIVSGYPDGSFKPDQTINRAEFTKIIIEAVFDVDYALLEACELGPPNPEAAVFPDVPDGSWFSPYVCVAKDEQLIGGYPDGSFQPGNLISFVEAAKIISIAFSETAEDSEIWYRSFVKYLGKRNAIPVEINSFDQQITRGQMAEMIYRIKAEITDKSSQTYDSLSGNGQANTTGLVGDSILQSGINGNEVIITTDGRFRYITSNGLPNHEPGTFPNAGNPNSISEQDHSYRVTLNPQRSSTPTDIQVFGVAVNGIPFEPGTAEAWNNDMSSGWNYDALSGNINLGLDDSNAHVQPTGTYHYHGIPHGLLGSVDHDKHSPLVGYAADGFPVYAEHGLSDSDDPDSAIIDLKPSYRLKSGTRPDGPGGDYDGTFVQDFEYVEGLGDLDECNGRETITPEYPSGTYAYFITSSYPFISRCIFGEADESFIRGGGQAGAQGGGPTAGPPQAARDACIFKTDGTACSFTDQNGSHNGTCITTPDGMACKPAGAP